jgi:hypothetical protein
MARIAVVVAFAAMVAAGMPSPGAFAALGLGMFAAGAGVIAFRRRDMPGATRLAAAAAVTLGTLGALLGGARLAIVALAIRHLERML